MSPHAPNSSISSRLTALAQRLGLIGRGPRQILERASELKLAFNDIPKRESTISWEHGIPWHYLLDLPRSALSGPVQEDKAHARSMLLKVVKTQQHSEDRFDLRKVDGLAHCPSEHSRLISLEQLAATDFCRQARIISYKDFVKTISLALPRFLAAETVQLQQASWHGTRLFWGGDSNGDAFASAIVYARRRELEVSMPILMTSYQLDSEGLQQLNLHYHVLAMPAAAWSDAGFMALLLEVPYSRLAFNGRSGATEILLLPKQSAQACALGEGLLIAGATDVAAHLQKIATG
ncbi:DUF6685 family protein [Pseudomonas segetis]|uniref:Uncharacterized protein n=1 Tax=Pseudomonas segetis TaxID=298908 RepID=A0A238ZXX8_9PSED|nr:DUF6685 family protein [Pseudomonas segetis]SNR88247.1 hypothetical protein SAMN05216255_0780 [Pseudomonas segetis]